MLQNNQMMYIQYHNHLLMEKLHMKYKFQSQNLEMLKLLNKLLKRKSNH